MTAVVIMLRAPANDNDTERRMVGYHRYRRHTSPE